ncbi:MAG: hypothetical protein ACPLRH_03730 [Desulfotomaculales bacterium]
MDARRHGPDYVSKVTRAYRQALAALEKGEKGPGKEDLLPLIPGGVTTGHFFRGVE